jgi:hypothetical protein
MMSTNQKEEKAGDLGILSIGGVIGFTIAIIGLILVLYGLFGHANFSAHSMGINIDLWWGLVMFIFGVIMGGGSYLSGLKKK